MTRGKKFARSITRLGKKKKTFNYSVLYGQKFVTLNNIGFQTSTAVDNYIHAVAYSSVMFLVANSGMRLLRRQHANSAVHK